MKKIFLLPFLLWTLTACTQSNPDAPVQVNEPDTQTITLTENEAIEIATALSTNLFDAYYPNLEGEEISDAQWDTITEQIKTDIKQYATDSYIKNNIYLYDDMCPNDFCSTTFPRDYDYLWKPSVTISSNEEFHIKGFTTNRYVSEQLASFEEEMVYKKVNNEWKIDQLIITEKDMNVTEDEVDAYLQQFFISEFELGEKEEDYTFETGEVDTVYHIKTLPEQSEYIFVPRIGDYFLVRLFWQEEDETFSLYEDFDYTETDDIASRDFDALFYDWGKDAYAIRNDIEEVNALDMRLIQLQTARILNYENGDEQALQGNLDELIVIAEQTFDYFFTVWDENTAQAFLSDHQLLFHDMLDYLEELPDETSTLDRIDTEFTIRYNQIMRILVTGYDF